MKNQKTFTFSSISKSRSVILIEGEDNKMESLKDNEIALIGVIKKPNVIVNPSNEHEPQWFIKFRKENDARWAKQEEFNNSINNVEPQWFINFKKENDARWAKQEEFNNAVLNFIKEQQKFNQEQQKFNKEQQKFNQEQQKFNELIVKRLDNIVEKNNLKE